METTKFKKLIDDSKIIYIASHLNPDGDNLGSITGMYSALVEYGKCVHLIIDDEVPVAERFLPNIDKSVNSSTLTKNPDLFITLDCADIDRLSLGSKELFLSAKNTINIDHHSTNTMFADVNIVDTKSPATGETLFGTLKEANIPLNKDSATSLYTAISSDTGSFKYDSVRKSTFLIAAELLDFNININEVAVNLYQNRSLAKTNLLIKAMNTLELYSDGKIGIVCITDKDIEECNADKSDADGIVEFVRDIDTVELAILLKEKSDCVRLSTRSKSYIDVTKIAGKFNGGGHIRASGATINLPINKAKEEVLKHSLEAFK